MFFYLVCLDLRRRVGRSRGRDGVRVVRFFSRGRYFSFGRLCWVVGYVFVRRRWECFVGEGRSFLISEYGVSDGEVFFIRCREFFVLFRFGGVFYYLSVVYR